MRAMLAVAITTFVRELLDPNEIRELQKALGKVEKTKWETPAADCPQETAERAAVAAQRRVRKSYDPHGARPIDLLVIASLILVGVLLSWLKTGMHWTPLSLKDLQMQTAPQNGCAPIQSENENIFSI
jgi:hypothetical protein